MGLFKCGMRAVQANTTQRTGTAVLPVPTPISGEMVTASTPSFDGIQFSTKSGSCKSEITR